MNFYEMKLPKHNVCGKCNPCSIPQHGVSFTLFHLFLLFYTFAIFNNICCDLKLIISFVQIDDLSRFTNVFQMELMRRKKGDTQEGTDWLNDEVQVAISKLAIAKRTDSSPTFVSFIITSLFICVLWIDVMRSQTHRNGRTGKSGEGGGVRGIEE